MLYAPTFNSRMIKEVGMPRRKFVLLCAGLSLLSGSAMGQGIGTMKIVINSSLAPNIPYGQTTTYTLLGDPSCGSGSGSVTNISWKYRFTGPNCSLGWSSSTSTGSNRTITYPESWVGNFIIHADVTVMCGYTSAVVPVEATVTVLPPDGIILPTPATTNSTWGQTINYLFPITSGGVRVGYISGFPSEDLTNIVEEGYKQPPMRYIGNLLRL
jgi:hypothetical protein